MKKIVLASKSPRRIKFLKELNLEFEIRPANIKESDYMDDAKDPIFYARLLAQKKAESSFQNNDELIIGADTIVVVNGEILGKPVDEQDAINMLKKLNGSVHEVITGISLMTSERILIDHEITKVKFKNLTVKEIENYVKSREPLDAAGAYKIQEHGGKFIDYIKGDKNNVIGFPLDLFKKLYKEIKK